MMGGGLRLGRLAGIPIGIHPLWVVVVALLTWSLGAEWFPQRVDDLSPTAGYLLGLASALLLFAGILAHELGHAIVARRVGVQVEEIDLWLLGGVARLRGEPKRPGDELRFAIAGPAVTAVFLGVFAGVYALAGDRPQWLHALLEYQVLVNALILGFNLLPAFPLDGGRVLRALLWRARGDRVVATGQAAALGRAFALVLGAFGILSTASGAVGGLWLLAVAAFLYVAGGAEAQSARIERALAGKRVADVAVAPVCIPAAVTVREAIDAYLAHHLYTSYPAIDGDGRLRGLLVIDRLRLVAPADRDRRTVGDVVVSDPALVVAPDTPVIDLLSRPQFARVGRAVVVDDDGRPIGLVSRTDVERLLRLGDIRGDAPALGH